jgi:hypothetical protein
MCVYLRIIIRGRMQCQERKAEKGEKGSELSDRIKIPQQICAYVKSLVVFFGSAVPLQRVYMLSSSRKEGKKSERILRL